MSEAQNLAACILDGAPTGSTNIPMMRVPVRIRQADGTEVDGEFNGYYDFTQFGQGVHAAVGYKASNGLMTSGGLRPGDQILTHVPSLQVWKSWLARQQQPQQSTNAA